MSPHETGSRPRTRAPIAFHLLITSMLFQGLSGLGGGGALVASPDGAILGLPPSLLEGTPFGSFLIPGLILLVVLGVAPAVVTWGLWRRRAWSWYGSVLLGTALVIWITVQILMIGYENDPPLQAIYGALGILMLGLSLSASVRSEVMGSG